MVVKHIKFILLSLVSLAGFSQTAPVSPTGMEELIRREQLNGAFSPSISLMVRPISWSSADSLFDFYRPLPVGYGLSILPVELRSSYSSHHPYPENDGAMVPSRFQSLVSAGAYWNNDWVSVQIKPELVYAPVNTYQGFPEENSDPLWARRYVWWNRTDNPETFGDDVYLKTFPGQSGIRVHQGGLSLGISTENLWWGPGKYNSITMSNNAPGFLHATFNTTRPLNTKIGSFEWQLIGGKLMSSGFQPPGTDRRATKTPLYVPKHEDWRYLSGLVVSYRPTFLEGLFVGYSNVVQQYGASINGLDILSGVTSIFTYTEGAGDRVPKYQLSAVFLRWLMSESQAEIYFEYGFQNSRKHKKLFDPNLYHTGGYILGFSKLFPLDARQGIKFDFEMTQLQQQPEEVRVTGESLYTNSRIRQGYTHRGEMIGAGIGPGSNQQMVEVSWVKGVNKVGLDLQRLAHNLDLYYFAFQHSGDYRKYWVDYAIGINTFWNLKPFTINGSVKYSYSINYQWQHPGNSDLPYFSPGMDIHNVQGFISLAYQFR